ncbi:MAG: hypothetical protein ACO3PY_06165 [Pontimonas sp.]
MSNNRFFKGQFDVTLIAPILIGLLYAGSGNWSAERWNTALALMGLGGAARAGERIGYTRGYGTFNPDLRPHHSPEGDPPRDEHGRFTRRH